MPHRSRYLFTLGVLFILIGGVQSGMKIVSEGLVLEAAIDFVLIAFPGVLLLYVGKWVATSDFDPELYPRIALWCMGGVGVMFVFLVLRAIHPGVTTSFSFGTRAIALSIGSIAGLAIGIHEARALTREEELTCQKEELERARSALEQRNEELAQAYNDLEETNQKLKESNERLEQFAYAASHDLQEPLRMVSMYLDLLESRHTDSLDDDALEFIDFAVDGATRMQTMIDDLLQFSRIDTQGAPFNAVDLESVFDDVLTDLQVQINETNAEITTEDLPTVEGDRSQLRQLIQNLLSNAIEYSGDNPPRVHLSTEKRENEWAISVSDDGIGIDPENQKRIFKIFQRLHSVDEHAGSGIGLALCQRIVERHHGEIWVDSKPGNGSTFSFTLPTTGTTSVLPDTSSQ